MDNFKNNLVKICFSNNDIIKGILIDFSDDWLLIQNNPVDFVIDGLSFVRTEKIKRIYKDEEVEFFEKGILLKKIPKNNVKLKDSLTKNLTLIESSGQIFALITKDENKIYPGKLLSFDDKSVFYKWIDLKGNWSKKRRLKRDKIRRIEFGTDYLTTIHLIAENF